MRQLLLKLSPESPPTLDNFIDIGNEAAFCALRTWLNNQKGACFYLWGERGSGKTHLLTASGFQILQNTTPLKVWEEALNNTENETQYLAIDHADQLNPDQQLILFNIFNHCHNHNGKLLLGASQPPKHIHLREDLRTRLGSGLIYRLHPLSDASKKSALIDQCAQRGMHMPTGSIDYLLSHAPRDMRSLSALIQSLDQYSLELKRPLTLPLLREVMAQLPPLTQDTTHKS